MTLGWVEAQRGFDRTGLAGNTLHRSCFNTMVIELIILITSDITNFRSITNTSITISNNISYAIIFIILIKLEWSATICIDPVPPNCHRLNSIDCDYSHIQNKLALTSELSQGVQMKERKGSILWQNLSWQLFFVARWKKVTEKSSP